MKVLVDAGDPRVTGDGTTFDNPPYAGADETPAKKEPAKKKAKTN
jgi:hypothetical protein